MTGYELSRNWFDWAFENPDLNTSNHTALFLWYVEKWNRCGQKEKFSVTTSESMEAIGIKSRNTISKVFKDLVKFGFINLIVESKNQHSCNIISLAQILCKHEDSNNTALDKALIQHRITHEDSTDTINKQVNKETSKQDNYGGGENLENSENEVPSFVESNRSKITPAWGGAARKRNFEIRFHAKRLLSNAVKP